MAFPVIRWFAPFVLAVVASSQQAASLVVRVHGEVRAVDLASGAIGPAGREVPRQPPPLRRRMRGMQYESVPTQAVWSPDGTLVAHVLRTFDTAAANGEIVITDPDGGSLVEVTATGGVNEDPMWTADGKRLVFVGRGPGQRRGLRVYHRADGAITESADQDLLLAPRPLFLADGFLLAIRRRRATDQLEPPKWHYDLVVDPCIAGRAPTVVCEGVPLPAVMDVSANGFVVWLLTENMLLRVDRLQRAITHRWTLAELGDAAWSVRLGQLAAHPDGDLAAVTFWGLGWRTGAEGGRDVVTLVEVPAARAAAPATPGLRRVVVGPDPRLLGFVSSPSKQAEAEAATKSESPR